VAANTTEASPAVNTPARIGAELTRAILRGEHAPGARLPALRDLAARYDVNPSTMQRVLARLESRGLVTARQGSGFTVNDPTRIADLSLAVDWLAAVADDPDRAASILADFLEVRRVLASRLVARHRLAVVDVVNALAAGAHALTHGEPDTVWEADVEVARVVVGATGNTAAVAVLNTLARGLAEDPTLVRAMYAEPARNAAAMVEVLGLIRDGAPDLANRIEATLAGIDEATVERYRALLAAGPDGVVP
jgi:DNA-binding FadR family transcriptional regulator